MGNDAAVQADGISKKYCKSLKRSMLYGMSDIGLNMFGISSRPGRLRRDEFWAVKDVSFEIKRGESFGIMGSNGSGKTTLLKMLNGIFRPDTGRITIRGRVGALIAVGAGFHPLLTGRENIYVNAAILGMGKREVDKKFDAIVDFADIGDFLDVPVKFYSSGMFVRLGFAVAVHCEPEVLLIDEVLAVGDRNFQIKCFRKLHELKKMDHVTVVFVSHNEYVMREYTEKCIILDHGVIVFEGLSEDAISFYINRMVPKKTADLTVGTIMKKPVIQQMVFRDGSGAQVHSIATGEKLIIDFVYETDRQIRKPIFGIDFYGENGLYTGLYNSYNKIALPDINGRGGVRVTLDSFALPVGAYRCQGVVCEEEESNVLEWRDLGIVLTVERPNDTRGLVKLKQTWEMREL